MFGFGKKKNAEDAVDKAAWASADFDKSVKNSEVVFVKEFERMTDMMIHQYHRIIMES